MRKCLPLIAILILLAGAVPPAWAHPGHAGHDFGGSDFIAGLAHPFMGLDHLLAMVAVGLLAVRIGGAALWMMPCAFLASMVLGGLMAVAGAPLPGVEYGIMSSVLVLGLLIAMTRVVPLSIGAALVALFALFHGYAHAAEMPSGSSLAIYGCGFLLASALLHAAGVLGGILMARPTPRVARRGPEPKPNLSGAALRVTGVTISAAGMLMFCGLL